MLRSKDAKAISQVGGTVAFFSGIVEVATVALSLNKTVAPDGQIELSLKQAEGSDHGSVSGNNDPSITALACVSDISYADGSGVIIN